MRGPDIVVDYYCPCGIDIRMNHLEQMGIQHWRLRQPVTQVTELESGDASIEVVENIQQITTTTPTTELSPEPAVSSSKGDRRKDLSDANWADLATLITGDELCASCNASCSILGFGDPHADWLFVIDSPSARDIDAQQLLTGRGGELFDAMLLALDLTRETIYLTSVFKCPPPEDVKTMAQCDAIVHRQIALVQPKVVVTLGEFASQAVIKANDGLSKLRTSEQRCFSQNIAIVPTHGLAQLLEQPMLKADVWDDLKRGLMLVSQ